MTSSKLFYCVMLDLLCFLLLSVTNRGRAFRHMSLNGFVRGVRLAKMSLDLFCKENNH